MGLITESGIFHCYIVSLGPELPVIKLLPSALLGGVCPVSTGRILLHQNCPLQLPLSVHRFCYPQYKQQEVTLFGALSP